jgi:hypothetical protein
MSFARISGPAVLVAGVVEFYRRNNVCVRGKHYEVEGKLTYAVKDGRSA